MMSFQFIEWDDHTCVNKILFYFSNHYNIVDHNSWYLRDFSFKQLSFERRKKTYHFNL